MKMFTQRTNARLSVHSLVAILAAVGIVSACGTSCPKGTEGRGEDCVQIGSSEVAGASGSGRAVSAGVGGRGGAAGSLTQQFDPQTIWQCSKSAGGACTSCRTDVDCPTHVCLQGVCMDCRQTTECGADEQCLSNRCVPDRKPSSVWTTGGGGLTTTGGFKLQTTIGAPQPLGQATTTGFKLSVNTIGPTR
jgi:hypothetical protein